MVTGELCNNKGLVDSGFQLKNVLDLQYRLLKLQAACDLVPVWD
jgi:hypothetical protein